MKTNSCLQFFTLVALTLCVRAQPTVYSMRPPMIDMHLHTFDSKWGGGNWTAVPWNHLHLPAPASEDDLREQSLAALREFNIVKAVASGPANMLERWSEGEPDRIMPSAFIQNAKPTANNLAALSKRHADGKLKALGEVVLQSAGVAPDDPDVDGYFSLAESLDVPLGIHMGLSPPGAALQKGSRYRSKLSSALLLETVLVRHPKLRLYVMHAGWPLLDDMVALLYAYPDVYVDVAVINWYIPRAEFHHYLKRLVDAGFGKRIMYGSDQMIWPAAIKLSIEGIESASFLTAEQKRDIFYNNAARFLRLTDDEIKRHHTPKP